MKIINLDKIQLSSIMPPNLLRDEKVRNLASVLSKELQMINRYAEDLNYTMNLRNLPESVIDHLLWENHIYPNEGLDLANTLEKKISLLENAIEIHRHKGTPFAVERSLESIGIKGKVIEWFEYEGNPYHFKVELETNKLTSKELMLLKNMIGEMKNTRSWLEEIVIKIAEQSILISNHTVHGKYPLLITNAFYTAASFGKGFESKVAIQANFIAMNNPLPICNAFYTS